MRAFTILSFLLVAGLATAQSANDLSLGQPASGPRVGEQYVKDVSGSWEVRCVKAEEGQKDRCGVYQLLRELAGNPIAEINVFTLAPGGEAVAGANIITPLETLLQPQIRISIDGAEARLYPFSFCRQNGCYARVGFTALDLAALERGTAAEIVIFGLGNPDTPVQIAMPLDGFTAAYDMLFD